MVRGLALGSLVLLAGACKGGAAADPNGIPVDIAADYIHSVIEADRANYAEHVVNRLQNVEKVVKASEKYKEDKALPLPSQMLRMGAQRASQPGKFQYALVSPWAINKANSPKSEFEKKAFKALMENADKPFKSYETVGDKKYFMAAYPDRAVSEACVNCHNNHPESPRSDFKLGDLMGGVIVSLAVGG